MDVKSPGLGMRRRGGVHGASKSTSFKPPLNQKSKSGGNGKNSIPQTQSSQRGLIVKKNPLVANQAAVLKKLYVLDTNVLMNDWSSLLRFEEHDIYIPLMVIRELDRNKKGHEDHAFNSRRTSSFLGELVEAMKKNVPNWKLKDGLALEFAEGGKPGMGHILIQTEEEAALASRLVSEHSKTSGDDHIISSTEMLINTRGKEYSEIILVSKDLNMRLLTLARGLQEEDYTTDIVTTGADDVLYSGMIELPAHLFRSMRQIRPASRHGDTALCEIDIPPDVVLYPNQLITGDPSNTHNWIVSEIEGRTAKLRHSVNYISDNKMYGINARNPEQNFLLNLLMDEDIDLVSILGEAGTGKTLMTMIAAFELVRLGVHNGIIYTRATVPVGAEDIGFLPGDEKDKMGAWAGALADNAEVIIDAINEKAANPESHHDDHRKVRQLIDKHSTKKSKSPSTLADISYASPARDEAIISLLKGIKVLNTGFMRGRSYLQKVLIIDEAQNNTPKQLKTLISRAGPGTKVIILGNLDQIDTPYVTASSSGLAYSIDRNIGWNHYGHIRLTRGERSRLAEHIVEVMK